MPVARTYTNNVWSASPTPAVPTPAPATPAPTTPTPIGGGGAPPMTPEQYESMLRGAKNQAQELALQRFAMQFGGSQNPFDNIWQTYMTNKYGHNKGRLINAFDQELGLPHEGMRLLHKDGKFQWQYDDRYDWDNITMSGVNGKGLVTGTDANGNVILNQDFFNPAWRNKSAATIPWAYKDYGDITPVGSLTDWTKQQGYGDYLHSVNRLNANDPTGWAAQYAGNPGAASAVTKGSYLNRTGGQQMTNVTPYASTAGGAIAAAPSGFTAPSPSTPPTPTPSPVPTVTAPTPGASTTNPTGGTGSYRYKPTGRQ